MYSNTITVRWTPAHQRFEGNETADTRASEAAEWTHRGDDLTFLRETSPSQTHHTTVPLTKNPTTNTLIEHATRHRPMRLRDGNQSTLRRKTVERMVGIVMRGTLGQIMRRAGKIQSFRHSYVRDAELRSSACYLFLCFLETWQTRQTAKLTMLSSLQYPHRFVIYRRNTRDLWSSEFDIN